ncbi:MAG: hypothetical protein MK008_02870 [Bdellovibrionales bacterium]|nr:hypothetical protein [Bdellovibrionales bacterium]
MKSLLFFIITILSINVFAIDRVRLESVVLEDAVLEYLSKTQEAEIIKKFLSENNKQHDKDSTYWTPRSMPIYIYGGAAHQIVSAVHEYLERKKGNKRATGLPKSFSRHLLSHISDVDIAVDATHEIRNNLVEELKEHFPEVVEGKTRWETVSLHYENDRGIFENKNINQQNTDAISSGMIRVLPLNKKLSKKYPSLYDVRTKNTPDGKSYLDAFLKETNYYFHSENHSETALAKAGKNPEIVSAVKYIANLARYELKGDVQSDDLVKKIITDYLNSVTEADLDRNSLHYILQRMNKILTKSLIESTKPSYAIDIYEKFNIPKLAEFIETSLERKVSSRKITRPTSYWMDYFKRNTHTLSTLEREIPKRLQSLDKLEHYMIIDGSQSHGGQHPKMFLDFNSEVSVFLDIVANDLKLRYTSFNEQMKAALPILVGLKAEASKTHKLDVIKLLANDDVLGCANDCRDTALRGKILAQKLGYKSFVVFNKNHSELYVISPENRLYSLSAWSSSFSEKDGHIHNNKGNYKPFVWRVPKKDRDKIQPQPPTEYQKALYFLKVLYVLKSQIDHEAFKHYQSVGIQRVSRFIKSSEDKTKNAIRLVKDLDIHNLKESYSTGVMDFTTLLVNIEEILHDSKAKNKDRFFKYVVKNYKDIIDAEYLSKVIEFEKDITKLADKLKIITEYNLYEKVEDYLFKIISIDMLRLMFSEDFFDKWLESVRKNAEKTTINTPNNYFLESVFIDALKLNNNDPLKMQAVRILNIIDHEFHLSQSKHQSWNNVLFSLSGYLVGTDLFEELTIRLRDLYRKDMFSSQHYLRLFIDNLNKYERNNKTEFINAFEIMKHYEIFDIVVKTDIRSKQVLSLMPYVLNSPDMDVWDKFIKYYEHGTSQFRTAFKEHVSSMDQSYRPYFDDAIKVIHENQNVGMSCRFMFY